MEQMLARLAELKAEGDAIMQQLMQAGMPPEEIMAAVEGGGQGVPPGVPAGPPPGVEMGGGGMPMGGGGMPMGGGGIPQGLLGVA